MLARRLVLGSAVVAALSVLLVVVVWLSTTGGDSSSVGRAEPPDAVATLADWDARRARAWAEGDVEALRGLYVAGSRTGRQDADMLSAYVDRGLRVRGLRTQVLRAQVLRHDDRAVVVSVTDRMRGAVAVGDDRRITLPADRASTREVTLRLVAGEWLVDEVRE
ncbi:hypothetical protein [Nocardioides sp. InS609-2]|uniref:hypothetical protein n=1 Tax=Nocardioides sp. InS609-2 TaxID=2760705 RepID=UPI0020BE9556|nr:hypothetical protein [Nocardioides sp. InS609-2]